MGEKSEAFNVQKKADEIEELALKRLDTRNGLFNYPTQQGVEAAAKLADAWRSLDLDERILVANDLQTRYHNAKPNKLPVPTIITNVNGEVIGIQFDASKLDFSLGPSSVKVTATDGAVVVKRNNYGSDETDGRTKDHYIADYTAPDNRTRRSHQ